MVHVAQYANAKRRHHANHGGWGRSSNCCCPRPILSQPPIHLPQRPTCTTLCPPSQRHAEVHLARRIRSPTISGTANGKTTYAALIGEELKSHYDSLCSFVADELDNGRNIWPDLDLESQDAATPKKRLREEIVAYIGYLRKNRLWHLKDDEAYIGLALKVFIRDSHHHRMKRTRQSSGSQRESVRSAARSNVCPDTRRGGSRGRTRGIKRPRIAPVDPKGCLPSSTAKEDATLATAIDIDPKHEVDDIRRSVRQHSDSTTINHDPVEHDPPVNTLEPATHSPPTSHRPTSPATPTTPL